MSRNTAAGYLADIAQFVSAKWGPQSEPPYDWISVGETDARSILGTLARDGAAATSVRRKLSALRTFFRFLRR